VTAMRAALVASLALLSALAAPAPAEACTTFCLSDGAHHLVGKSYDWDMEQGLVVANPRGLHKRALLVGGGRDRPAEWDARYASITFNQYGREMPNGGMNEAGLVVEVMWLDATRAPAADQRPAVGELQWIQMQLDTKATVAEVVRAADAVRVAPMAGKVHYMACDATGACAAFENLGGRMVVTHGRELVAKVLTNDTYRASRAALAGHRGSSGERAVPRGGGSLARFVRAARMLAGRTGRPERKAALAVLDDVRQGSFTKWNIVYDPVALRIAFRTLSRPALKEIDLKALAASCRAGARILDMATTARGDVTAKFTAYSFAANKRLVDTSLAPVAGQLPRGAAWLVAGYPATARCAAR
jgi:penicillin V acylase-like amidase (Ntn superfamily)